MNIPVEVYRLKVIMSGLKLEINTGMRHSRGSVFAAAKRITGQKTRQKCLEMLEKMVKVE